MINCIILGMHSKHICVYVGVFVYVSVCALRNGEDEKSVRFISLNKFY